MFLSLCHASGALRAHNSSVETRQRGFIVAAEKHWN